MKIFVYYLIMDCLEFLVCANFDYENWLYIYIVHDGGYMALGIKSTLNFISNEESKKFKKLLNGGAWKGILRKGRRDIG